MNTEPSCPLKNSKHLLRLSELQEGDVGKVIGIRGGPRNYRQRLVDLGLTPGTIIRVRREAPFGDPIEIELKGFHLVLRRKDAWHIIIERLPEQ